MIISSIKKKKPNNKDLAKQFVLHCAELALDKKAFNLVILDVRPWQGLMDYLLICSAQSSVQAQSLSDYIYETLKKEGRTPIGMEGREQGRWVLLDYGEVVIHVFYEYIREFYDLEGLWQDASRLRVPKHKR
ncbi:MAG: ribosome silencing factor [Deltaproteobacteria bacterium]|nr:ribosome silencing factor [Deltaproteobacteria bacterium]